MSEVDETFELWFGRNSDLRRFDRFDQFGPVTRDSGEVVEYDFKFGIYPKF